MTGHKKREAFFVVVIFSSLWFSLGIDMCVRVTTGSHMLLRLVSSVPLKWQLLGMVSPLGSRPHASRLQRNPQALVSRPLNE